jgi:hypothetical protein
MSLSAEALAQLDGLNLQEARDALVFVSTAGLREPLGVDLSGDEMAGVRSWDLSGVLAKLNGLTFEAVHPELATAPAPMPAPELPEEELPSWLRPAEPAASPAEEEPPAPQRSEQDQWDGLSDNDKNADLNRWYKKWRDLGEEPEGWQKELLKKYGFWGGGDPPKAAGPSGSPAEEEAEAGLTAAETAEMGAAIADSISGAGGKIREFLKSERGQKMLVGVKFAAGGVLGVIIADILKLGPGQEALIAVFAQSGLGFARLGTEFGARAVERAEVKSPRFARLSRKLAGEVGLAGVLRSNRDVFARLQSDPVLAGMTAGVIGHSFYEALSGHASMLHGISAAEPTTPAPAGDGLLPDERSAVEGGKWRGGHGEAVVGDESGRLIPRPEPPIQPAAEAGGPPTLSPEASELVNRAGEVAAQEAGEMADAAQGAADIAARQAALDAATRVHAVGQNETLSAIVTKYGGDPYKIDMTHTILRSAGELTGGTDLAGNLRPGADAAGQLIEYLKTNPTVTWQQAINEGLKTSVGEPVAKLFADATRMIYQNKLLNVVVGAGV